jgi:hypothetical protein
MKVGDWGQCEFDIGGGEAQAQERPVNDDIPREEEYNRKWGNYPADYSPGQGGGRKEEEDQS